MQGWVGCFPISNSSVGLYDYVLVIIYESGEPDIKSFLSTLNRELASLVVLILTLWSGWQRFRHSATPLLSILYRDGVLFFVLLVGESIHTITYDFRIQRFCSPVPGKCLDPRHRDGE